MKKKINLQIKNQFIKNITTRMTERLKPLKAYWITLSSREQKLLMSGGIVLVVVIAFMGITSAIELQSDLQKQYLKNAQYHFNAEVMSKEYRDLISITSNDFSSVNSEKIKGDVNNALGNVTFDVILSDNTLIINVAEAPFENSLLLLDQLRRSYGLFPIKLKMTRLSKSGFVAFSASFNVEK